MKLRSQSPAHLLAGEQCRAMTGIYFRFPGPPASPFQSHALSPADGHLFSINLPAPLFLSLSSSISTSLSALSWPASCGESSRYSELREASPGAAPPSGAHIRLGGGLRLYSQLHTSRWTSCLQRELLTLEECIYI